MPACQLSRHRKTLRTIRWLSSCRRMRGFFRRTRRLRKCHWPTASPRRFARCHGSTAFHRCCRLCQQRLPDCRDCRSPWRSPPAVTGGSVQTPRDSDAGAFGAVGSALPADPETPTGSSRQHHSPRDALTSVHDPAPPSRPGCAGARCSEPAQTRRPRVPTQDRLKKRLLKPVERLWPLTSL